VTVTSAPTEIYSHNVLQASAEGAETVFFTLLFFAVLMLLYFLFLLYFSLGVANTDFQAVTSA
jgi:hypothetical protein